MIYGTSLFRLIKVPIILTLSCTGYRKVRDFLAQNVLIYSKGQDKLLPQSLT